MKLKMTRITLLLICLILNGCTQPPGEKGEDYYNYFPFGMIDRFIDLDRHVLITTTDILLYDKQTGDIYPAELDPLAYYAQNTAVDDNCSYSRSVYPGRNGYYYLKVNPCTSNEEYILQEIFADSFRSTLLMDTRSTYLTYLGLDTFLGLYQESVPVNEFNYELLESGSERSLFVVGDYIYKIEADQLYRSKTREQAFARIEGVTIRNGQISIAAGMVYYIDLSNRLIAYDLATRTWEVVFSGFCTGVYVSQDLLIYRDDQKRIYGVDRLDFAKRFGLEETIASIAIVDDLLYYTDAGQGYQLFRINTDGSNQQLVLAEAVSSFMVDGDWLYAEIRNKFYRINLITGAKTLIYNNE